MLEKNNVKCFFSKASLPQLSNSAYKEAIDDALENSIHFVLCLSKLETFYKRWPKFEANWFEGEIREGRKSGNLLIASTGDFFENEVLANKKENFPPYLRQVQCISIDRENALVELLSYLTNHWNLKEREELLELVRINTETAEFNAGEKTPEIKMSQNPGNSFFDNLKWFKIKNGELCKYYGLAQNIVIPKNVTKINRNALSRNRKAISIVMPEGVKEIDNSAFFDCTNLSSITIPQSVTRIGWFAFDRCHNLKEVNYKGTIGDWCNLSLSFYYGSNPVYFAKRLFVCGKNVTEITASDLEGVKSIGLFAFNYLSDLSDLTLSDDVTTIGSFAFCHTNLKSIRITKNIDGIGPGAFADCALLESIDVDKENTNYKCVDNCLIDTRSQSIILGCKNSIIPNNIGIKSIGDYAFAGCAELKSVTLPEGITSIGDYAFEGCTELTSITIPDSVTTIGREAFRNCTKLKKVAFPQHTLAISRDILRGSAFYEDSSNWKNGLLYVGNHLIASNNNVPATCKLLSETRDIAAGTFSMDFDSPQKKIIIPHNNLYIDEMAFDPLNYNLVIEMPEGYNADKLKNLFSKHIGITINTYKENNWEDDILEWLQKRELDELVMRWKDTDWNTKKSKKETEKISREKTDIGNQATEQEVDDNFGLTEQEIDDIFGLNNDRYR